jgi:predicted SprT family Zn-dependent metalloprotease
VHDKNVDDDDMRNDKEKTFVNPIQSDSSDVDAELFECDMCDKRLESKKEIDEHKGKTHNGCKLCDKKFDSMQ